ncbi:MAG: VCBS repeat-containing protein [Ignavibacteriae bacterium]|nr:MAG: VCBS repeat-containing protein [Ignavibacteriota bacterium]
MAITILTAFAIPHNLQAQTWPLAGQMIGPLMWEFPLSLPDGTHLIPLRWLNQRNNDSLYWFDIKSFTTTPKMYERQTLGYRSIRDLRDFDSDGLMDLSGQTFSALGTITYAALTDKQHIKGVAPGGAGALYGITNRYFGDIDGDGLNDDLSSDGPNAVRIVYGDNIHPLIGPSYVDIHDNKNPQYPDLEPTNVAAVGMLGRKPCVVQMYSRWPGFYTYELVELNLDDLRQRKARIRTTLLAKIDQPGAAYGLVVLRTPDVWWLFDPNNDDGTKGRGMKVTPTSISLEPVSDYWRGGWQQYYGQGGQNTDQNFPRVMDGNRPILKESIQTRTIPGMGEVQHTVISLSRITNVETAEVEILGSTAPPDSQCLESYPAERMTVVPDVDKDGIEDFMVSIPFKLFNTTRYSRAVSLYLTSQRPTVSVKEAAEDSSMLVVDQGETWLAIGGVSCTSVPAVSAEIYDVSGAIVAIVTLSINGTDLILDKPKPISHQALWLRLGSCTLRLP